MKKYDVVYSDEVKEGDVCSCHNLPIFKGTLTEAERYKIADVCPSALMDFLVQRLRQLDEAEMLAHFAMWVNSL